MLAMPHRLICLLLVLLMAWPSANAGVLPSSPASLPSAGLSAVAACPADGLQGAPADVASGLLCDGGLPTCDEWPAAPSAWPEVQTESIGEPLALLPSVDPPHALALAMQGPPTGLAKAPPGPWLEGPLRPPRGNSLA